MAVADTNSARPTASARSRIPCCAKLEMGAPGRFWLEGGGRANPGTYGQHSARLGPRIAGGRLPARGAGRLGRYGDRLPRDRRRARTACGGEGARPGIWLGRIVPEAVHARVP